MVTPPPATQIPEGEAQCPPPAGAGEMCLSDEQNANLLMTYEAGERARDRMICWLRVYLGYPACD